MKVFVPTSVMAIHTLIFIPRRYVATATMTLRYELREIVTTRELECTTVGNYLTANFEYQFTEEGTYEIEVMDDYGLLYRCKAFATAQTDLQNYKMI